MEAWKEELYHHGILGMRWGKKNGPPYPLGAGDHSAAEKKAGWRKSLSGSGSGSSAKERRKQRDRAIQDRYDREIERIESKSKGKYLSEKEMARQNAAEKKASNDWAKSKERYKADKQLDRYNKQAEGILSARAKNREKISNRFDKKIDKSNNSDIANIYKEKKKAQLKDFDTMTKYVKSGQNKYRSVIENNMKANVAAINSSDFKNSKEYKLAKKAFREQKIMSAMYGSSWPTLVYVSEELNKKK